MKAASTTKALGRVNPKTTDGVHIKSVRLDTFLHFYNSRSFKFIRQLRNRKISEVAVASIQSQVKRFAFEFFNRSNGAPKEILELEKFVDVLFEFVLLCTEPDRPVGLGARTKNLKDSDSDAIAFTQEFKRGSEVLGRLKDYSKKSDYVEFLREPFYRMDKELRELRSKFEWRVQRSKEAGVREAILYDKLKSMGASPVLLDRMVDKLREVGIRATRGSKISNRVRLRKPCD